MKPSRHLPPRTGFLLLIAAAAVAALAACMNNPANPAKGFPVVGTYRLALVNGSPLPYDSGGTYTLSGNLDVKSDVTYTLSETDSSSAGKTTFSSSGQWSVFAQQLTLIDANSGVYIGTLSAQLDSVTITVNGHTSEYAKN